MLYTEFINKTKKLTINQLENGTWYLEPEWRDLTCRNVTEDIENLTDSYIRDWWDVENILRLEVDRRNAMDSKKKDVIDWLYDLITAQVEPAMMQEETDYIKQVVEFMKENHGKDNIVEFPIKNNEG